MKKSRFSKSRERREKMQESYLSRSSNGTSTMNLSEGVKRWFPKKDDKTEEYIINIVPYILTKEWHPDFKEKAVPDEDIWFRRPYAIHWLDGKPYVCPKYTINEPCPICEYHDSLDDKEDEKAKVSIRAQHSVLYPAFIGDSDELVVFDWKYSKFSKLLDKRVRILSKRNPKIKDFWDCIDGYSLVVGLDTVGEGSYKRVEAVCIDFEERDIIDEDIVETKVPKLDDIFNILSYEQLNSIINGSPTPSEEETVNEKPEKEYKTDNKWLLEDEEESEQKAKEDSFTDFSEEPEEPEETPDDSNESKEDDPAYEEKDLDDLDW